MFSAIYSGMLRHRRFMPRRHSFRYRVFMMYLDLAELDEVLALSRWWSTKPWFPARFQREDFLGDPRLSLDQAVRMRIREQTGETHQGPIRLLANLRYFGVNKNPLACYYCFSPEQRLTTIVAEVNNEPWNERHSYVLPCDPARAVQRIQFSKCLHVSPFNPMAMTYHWRSNCPEEKLALHIENWRGDHKVADATLGLARTEITSQSLAAVLWQYPWMTAKVLGAIYWQAARLWLKGVPVHNHPGIDTEKKSHDVTEY